MELVGGRSLHHWSRLHGPMPLPLALRATLDLCDALAHAHAAGIVHRDVKPENALVGPGGRTRLVDFGIARLADTTLTRTGIMMGSRGYMAPEQETNAKDADPRADVYSVAVTLAALVTAQDPRPLETCMERFGHMVPDTVALAVLRATVKDRDQRTPTVERLAAGLRRGPVADEATELFIGVPGGAASSPR
jgi:serine/threonine-protein kinase